jgi:hypothetical protein
MQQLFQNPAIEAGAAPLIVALIVLLALGRTRFDGLAIAVAFATAVALASGFSVTPLTATRKIVLLTLGASALGVVLGLVPAPGRIRSALAALAATAATLWVFWPVLANRPIAEAALLGATAVPLIAWLAGYVDAALAPRPVECGAAVLLLGLGAGRARLVGEQRRQQIRARAGASKRLAADSHSNRRRKSARSRSPYTPRPSVPATTTKAADRTRASSTCVRRISSTRPSSRP